MAAEAGSAQYVPRVMTKAPPWHGWVTADLFFSSLGAGTFAVAAICLLARPGEFAPVARIAVMVVFPVMLADLACLIIDLGDPARFHHMLRVFKPGSPMSVGVWTLSTFTFIAFFASAATILRLSNSILELIAAIGLIPALIAGTYKGVLLSTTAQPGWSRMRWLGATFSISSATIGLAVMIAAAELFGPAPQTLRVCLVATLFLLGFGVGEALEQVYRRTRNLMRSGARFALFITLIWPAVTMVGRPVVLLDWSAVASILIHAILFRRLLVVTPHRLSAK